MAQLVLGLATSHSPQLSTLPEFWSDRGERDRRNPELIGTDGISRLEENGYSVRTKVTKIVEGSFWGSRGHVIAYRASTGSDGRRLLPFASLSTPPHSEVNSAMVLVRTSSSSIGHDRLMFVSHPPSGASGPFPRT